MSWAKVVFRQDLKGEVADLAGKTGDLVGTNGWGGLIVDVGEDRWLFGPGRYQSVIDREKMHELNFGDQS